MALEAPDQLGHAVSRASQHAVAARVLSEPAREHRSEIFIDPAIASVPSGVAERRDVTPEAALLVRRVDEVPDPFRAGCRGAPGDGEMPLVVLEQPLNRSTTHDARLASKIL